MTNAVICESILCSNHSGFVTAVSAWTKENFWTQPGYSPEPLDLLGRTCSVQCSKELSQVRHPPKALGPQCPSLCLPGQRDLGMGAVGKE